MHRIAVQTPSKTEAAVIIGAEVAVELQDATAENVTTETNETVRNLVTDVDERIEEN